MNLNKRPIKSKRPNLAAVPFNEHYPPRFSRLTSWRHSDYRELFCFVGLASAGAYWHIKHSGRILTRDVILTNDIVAADARAKRAARVWVKENLPGAVLRFRRVTGAAECVERRRAA